VGWLGPNTAELVRQYQAASLAIRIMVKSAKVVVASVKLQMTRGFCGTAFAGLRQARCRQYFIVRLDDRLQVILLDYAPGLRMAEGGTCSSHATR
jgi:hypothetical protein